LAAFFAESGQTWKIFCWRLIIQLTAMKYQQLVFAFTLFIPQQHISDQSFIYFHLKIHHKTCRSNPNRNKLYSSTFPMEE